MSEQEPFATYLELRESTPEGEVSAGLSHSSEGLVLLHVLELAAAGEPRGAVTFVHDAGGHGARYLPLARDLARAGWAVALPDLRGHGRSEGPRGHTHGLREVLRDLGDVQDHVAYRMPEAPRVLVGAGLGALYALAFARERAGELAALVLAAPLLEPRFEPPAPPRGLKKLFGKVGPTSEGRLGWPADALTADARTASAWRADELTHDVVTLRAADEARAAAERHARDLAGLSCPVLVLHGADDPLTSAERVRAWADGSAELEVLPGMRHEVLAGPGSEPARERLVAWLGEQRPS